MLPPNLAAPVDAPITLLLAIVRHWRRATEQHSCPKLPMRRILILSMVLMSSGCVSRQPHERHLSLAHEVRVPSTWASGRATPSPPGYSDIEHYVEAYERGWWSVVHEYAKNIDYEPPPGFWAISGWAAESEGWFRGTGDAFMRIDQMIGAFGKRKVSEYLAEFKDSAWYDDEP